jgi:hypothetical protein
MLTDFREAAVDALVATTVGSPLLSVEVRHLGGAVGRPSPEHDAVSHFDDEYLMFAVGIAPTPEAQSAVGGAVGRLMAALEPWSATRMYANFAETKRAGRSFHTEAAHHRLKRIKAAVDPTNLIRANHEL